MNFILIFLLFAYLKVSVGFFAIVEVASNNFTYLPMKFELAIRDIAESLPTKSITIVRGNSTDIRPEDLFELFCLLNKHYIQIINLDFKTEDNKAKYYGFVRKALDVSEERTSLILCLRSECETILVELTDNNLIHRTITYIFFWPHEEISKTFLGNISEAMRVTVITNPREGVFRVYYNQATPDKLNYMTMVNWWSGKLYKSPVLPPADKTFKDFRGRLFYVPVLHAPPWHFVQYKNDSSISVTGGRDDKLLALLANSLNFRYKYFDPPERSQGSGISGNGTFRGTLGLIWKRKADFFLGDVSMTWERLQAVEFSFMTLADSGAFLTHAPAKLSESLAIIRPFKWEVWPLVSTTIALSGIALWFVIAAPSFWQKNKIRNQMNLLNSCCWFILTLFLRQSSNKEPSKTHKARIVSILVSLGATYVIGDMYSANLTSLLARPAREKPIGTLEALEEAMKNDGYELVVERHSSSLSLLQNGTGVYGRLARLMRRQKIQRVRNIETGVRLVLARRKIAILGGRETLYYDTEKFGSHNFHLSEKLHTRYSAIALQIGSPYLETFNNVLMTLFEAGILSKITTDEYRNLPKHSRRSDPVSESDRDLGDMSSDPNGVQVQTESSIGLHPVSLRMLQGAFYLLGLGQILSAVILAFEIEFHRRAAKKAMAKQKPARQSPSFKAIAQAKIIMKRALRRTAKAVATNIDQALGPTV